MTTKQQPTNVSIAKAGLDKITSAMCKQQRGSGRRVSIWLIVVNFNNIFSIEHLYPAGRAMNPLPSQIFNVSSHVGQTSTRIETLADKPSGFEILLVQT